MSQSRSIHWLIVLILAGSEAWAIELPPSGADEQSPRERVCLNGLWQFCAVGTSVEAPPIDGWRPFRVPSSWGESGTTCFAITPGELASPRAWYQRDVPAPVEWRNNGRIKLRFELLIDAWKVLFNGTQVGTGNTLALGREFDVTDLIRFDKPNTISVLTCAFVSAEDKKLQCLDRGVVRDVFLLHRPAVHLPFSDCYTSVRNQRLTVRTAVCNESATVAAGKVAAQVFDNGRPVLSLPPVEVSVAPGETVDLETSAAWTDPVLWGFGEYGEPHLYTLRTSFEGQGLSDCRDDRFGFREFRIEGQTFTLNGKPIFIKGDLISRRGIFPEHASYITAFYQRLRDTGGNLLRLHTRSPFDDQAWYEVADETGMLVEAQLSHLTTNGRNYAADSPESIDAWNAYVRDNFNHPSLVFWCVDNESFSVPGKEAPNIREELVRSFDRLMTYVRKLDPTRVAEIHHNWTLFYWVRKNVFSRDNFTTFNIHPYGKLDTEVLAAMRDVEFDNSVPVVIGEVYTFPKDTDFVNRPGYAYGEQYRKARSYEKQIAEVATVPGVASIITCAVSSDGYIGFTDPEKFHLGPWDDLAVMRNADGKVAGQRKFSVDVRWPSLSGTGLKAEFIPGCHNYWAETSGANLNWFDSARPMFRSNLVDASVREAFSKLPGAPAVSLNQSRAAEIVVVFANEGKPVEGAIVRLKGLESQARGDAVITDSQGTAWFRLWETGRYRAETVWQGRRYAKDLTIAARPQLNLKPGYDHVQWVGLGEGNPDQVRAAVSQPITIRDVLEMPAGATVLNGNMQVWKNDECPWKWTGKAVRAVDKENLSAELHGPAGQLTQFLKLEKGRTYTLSGRVLTHANGSAKLQVKSDTYAALISLSPTAGEDSWKPVSGEFSATGPCYVYATVDGPGDAVARFDDIQVTAGPEVDPAIETFSAGPFDVTGAGFLRHWLVLAPFPNRQNPDGTYEGHATDWLAASGGEPNAAPSAGDTCEVEFPKGSYWKSGRTTLTWSPLTAKADHVRLQSIGLPSMNIPIDGPTSVCAYLASIVVSPEACDAVFCIGSDDGYKAWLNGVQIGELGITRTSKVDQESLPVRLRKGENRLLLKVFQDSGAWNCIVRFKDLEGNPLKGLKVRLPGRVHLFQCLTPKGGGRPVALADGSRFAYEWIDSQKREQIMLRSIQTGEETVIGEGYEPLAAADGTGIYFLRGERNNPHLMSARCDGTPPVELATPQGLTRLHGWVDNGMTLIATVNGSVARVTGFDGKNPSVTPWTGYEKASAVVVAADGNTAAVVLPDGNGIASLRIVSLKDDHDLVSPRTVPPSTTGRVGGCQSPAISADGKHVVYVRAGIQPDSDLRMIDLSNGAERALTQDGARNQAPAFIRDGTAVLFSSSHEDNEERIYLKPLTPAQ